MGISPFTSAGLLSIFLVEPSWPTVVVAGIVLVLAVLLVLYLLIVLEGAVFRSAGRKSAEAVPAPVVPAPAAPAPVAAAPAPAVAAGIPGEVVAAIAGALACMEPEGVRYAVQSIAPAAVPAPAAAAAPVHARTGRSAWAQAGIAANTQPF